MNIQEIQRCYVCNAPTGFCGEDSIYLPPIHSDGSDLGPLCEACCYEIVAQGGLATSTVYPYAIGVVSNVDAL